jgi:hypothetical protein
VNLHRSSSVDAAGSDPTTGPLHPISRSWRGTQSARDTVHSTVKSEPLVPCRSSTLDMKTDSTT